MTSDFRRKKIAHIFGFFDQDKNNAIEKKDFELSVQYIANKRGWKTGDAKYNEVEKTMLKVWDSLQKHADKDNDGQVSLDEWVEMWDAYAKNPSSPLEWQTMYSKHIFDTQDASGDGAIDVEEYSSVMQSFGLEKSVSVSAFQKMAKGKDKISWQEFQDLWKEFFISEDPNAPGNFIFGGVF